LSGVGSVEVELELEIANCRLETITFRTLEQLAEAVSRTLSTSVSPTRKIVLKRIRRDRDRPGLARQRKLCVRALGHLAHEADPIRLLGWV
jgi:RNA 3'-terminal phosphate cyclase